MILTVNITERVFKKKKKNENKEQQKQLHLSIKEINTS